MDRVVYDKIDAVIKLTERCNIACTYCYMFFKGSELYRSKPTQMSNPTVEALAKFLKEGAELVKAKTVRIIIHGGEPLLVQPIDFEHFCSTLKSGIEGDNVNVQFSVQTNAMRINEHWINVFSKFQISVGVSLDGNKEDNDKNRIDHKGNGTYDRVLKGITQLKDAHSRGLISEPAVLSVIDPDKDGAESFKHFVEDVGLSWIDFLLPIDTIETFDKGKSKLVGKFLVDAFDAWLKYEDPNIQVRFFDNFYAFLTGTDRLTGQKLEHSEGTLIVTFSSDGTCGPDDTLRMVDEELFAFDATTNSLESYLAEPNITHIESMQQDVHEECKSCAWHSYCRGGSANGRLVNRFMSKTGFHNKSVLCEGLKEIYSEMAARLIDNGYPVEVMEKRLLGTA